MDRFGLQADLNKQRSSRENPSGKISSYWLLQYAMEWLEHNLNGPSIADVQHGELNKAL